MPCNIDYNNNNYCKTCNILALDVILTLRSYNFFVRLQSSILTSACVGY